MNDLEYKFKRVCKLDYFVLEMLSCLLKMNQFWQHILVIRGLFGTL